MCYIFAAAGACKMCVGGTRTFSKSVASMHTREGGMPWQKGLQGVTVLQWMNWVLAYLQGGGVDFSAVIYAAADVGAADAAMFEFGGAN